MPRDGSNIYHRPAGTDGVPNFPIESSKYNAYVADVEQDLNLPRPIVAGGTGATNADGALTNLSAEKAAQIVTNWDATVWMAGSYYAATTATGAAPVAGHAFAGISYVSNATVPITDMVLEATDLTDPANPDKYIRIMSSGVWSAWTRLNPNTSSANLGEYTFNNQVTFPPASGQIRFNNATENSTTEVFISHLTATGFDNTTQITSYLLSGVDFVIQDKDEGNKYKVFTTTAAVVLSGGDFRVTVALKIAGLDVVTTQRMLVTASGEAQRVQQRQLIYAAPFDALAYNGMQINGSMEVSQEKGSAATTSTGYFMDGWQLAKVGTSAVSVAQGSLSQFDGLPNYAVLTVGTAQSSMTASDIVLLYTTIEGYRIRRVGWQTASPQSITIGFWSRHFRIGTYSVAIQNSVGSHSYVATYSQIVSDVPEFKTITIPPPPAGAWATDNTTGMFVVFTIASGATFVTPANNTWQAGNYRAAIGQVNGVAATSDVFKITGVVVLPGIEAPSAARSSLIMRPYDQELLTCQRYYRQWGGTNPFEGIANGQCFSTTGANYLLNFDPSMRSTPAFSLAGSFIGTHSANTTVIALTALTLASATPNTVSLNGTVAGGLVAGDATKLLCNNDLTVRVKLDARL